MQGAVTAGSLFSTVLMQRQVDDRLFLLVEGDDEEILFADHLDTANILLLVAGGKHAVLGAANLIDSQAVKGALALVDRDFDDLTGASATYPPSVIATHGYDLINDVVLTSTSIFRRSLLVNGKETISKIESSTGLPVETVVGRLAMSVTALRLVNLEKSLGLNMKDFPFDFIVTTGFQPEDLGGLLAVVNGRSRNKVLETTVAPDVTQASLRINNDAKHCGGHDLMRAAAAVLRFAGVSKVTPKQIEIGVMSACSKDVIERLPIFNLIELWAQSFSKRTFVWG